MNTKLVGNVSIAALFILTGCGEAVDVVSSTEGTAPSAPTAKHESPAKNLAPQGEVALVSISGFAHDTEGAPVSGVQVCLQAGPTVAMDIGDCATSQIDGSWTLHDVPGNMLVTIGLEKAGFARTIRAIQTEASDIQIPADENRMIAISNPPTFAGAPMDPQTGAIEFFVGSESADALATVSLFSFDNGVREPVYFDLDGNPIPGAKSGSLGGFANLPPGMYVATFKSASGACTTTGELYGYPMNVFPQPGEANIVVPVAAGRITTPVGVNCTGSDVSVGH